jgi:ABC-2 type transport system permease protein
LRLPNLIPGPGRYYGFITAAIILFAALSVPEALCPDKRSRFLGVYLSSPLNRSTYLLAKAIAVMGVLLLVTLGPPLLLLIGLALQDDGPRTLAGFMETLGQILAAGVSLSLMFGALSLAIPSLTDRRAFASAGTLLLILGSTAITNVIVFGLGGPKDVLALSLGRLPFELALRIFTLNGLSTAGGVGSPNGSPLSTGVVVAVSVAVTLAAGALTWWRVVGTEVTR